MGADRGASNSSTSYRSFSESPDFTTSLPSGNQRRGTRSHLRAAARDRRVQIDDALFVQASRQLLRAGRIAGRRIDHRQAAAQRRAGRAHDVADFAMAWETQQHSRTAGEHLPRIARDLASALAMGVSALGCEVPADDGVACAQEPIRQGAAHEAKADHADRRMPRHVKSSASGRPASAAAWSSTIGRGDTAQGTHLELVWRGAEHDVEACRELAQFGAGQRAEIYQQGLEGPRFEILDDAVSCVGGMSVDQQLRCEHPSAVLTDGDMNMRGSKDADQRVLDRFDGPEVVLAFRIAQESPVPLKVLVEPGWLTTTGVHVGTRVVDLPDLDERIAHRLTRSRQHPPGEVSNVSDGWRNAVVDDQEIVVGVERQDIRIERSFRGGSGVMGPQVSLSRP